MHTEFEAKFPLDVSKDAFREILRRNRAELRHAERLMQRVLFGQEHNPGITCDYIRVRDEGDKITLSAKTHAAPDGDMSDQQEAVTVVADFAACLSVLEQAGLQKSSDQQNKRESWVLGETHIEIDTWPGLPPHVEIEAVSEARVQQVAELLELDWERRLITSVEELYMEKYGLPKLEVRARLAFCSFEKPGFME